MQQEETGSRPPNLGGAHQTNPCLLASSWLHRAPVTNWIYYFSPLVFFPGPFLGHWRGASSAPATELNYLWRQGVPRIAKCLQAIRQVPSPPANRPLPLLSGRGLGGGARCVSPTREADPLYGPPVLWPPRVILLRNQGNVLEPRFSTGAPMGFYGLPP